MKKLKVLMPNCMGTGYNREDKVCNGDKAGATDDDRAPCLYRDKCVATSVHCRRESKTVHAYLQPYKHTANDAIPKGDYMVAIGDCEHLQSLMRTWTTQFRVRNGIAAGAPVGAARPIADATAGKAHARKNPVAVANGSRNLRPGVRNDEGRRAVTDIANHYTRVLLEKIQRTMATGQAEANVGEVFLVDKLKHSGYVAVYAKAKDGRKQAITSFYIKPNNTTTGERPVPALEVRVAGAYEDIVPLFTPANRGRCAPEDITGKDGAFTIRFRHLDKACCTIVADAIASAVKRGIIGLPEAS